MKKSMNFNSRAAKAVRLIHAGATWDEVEEKLGFGKSYLQKIIKDNYYKSDVSYNNLLAKARENEKSKKRIVIIETNVWLKGCELPNEQLHLLISNRGEIERFASQKGRSAEKILNDPRIVWEESPNVYLPVYVKGLFKPRTIEIVALCVKYINKGYSVELITAEREVYELAGIQKYPYEKLKITPIFY